MGPVQPHWSMEQAVGGSHGDSSENCFIYIMKDEGQNVNTDNNLIK